MKQNQIGSGKILLITAIILVLVVAGWWFTKGKALTSPAEVKQIEQAQNVAPTPPPSPTIQNDNDLMQASADMDHTNVDSAFDPTLNQNDADMQTFAPRIRLKNGTSTNWAGYAVETDLSNPQNNAVSDVKGSWTVPTVDCTGVTQNTYSASWLGIDGYSDSTVEQTGTEHDCRNGQPSYYAWFEMYPKPGYIINNFPVRAGDNISAEVKYTSGNRFVLILANLTTGKTFTTTQRSNGLRQSAEWIVEAPWSGGVLPLANFGNMQFNSAQATVKGHTGTISDSAWQNDAITMTDSSGNPKATPSGLSPDGSGFSVQWNSN